MTRGRDAFKMVRPVLVTLAYAVSLLPNSMTRFLLVVSRRIPTRVGVGLRYVLIRGLARVCGDNVSISDAVYLFHVDRIQLGSHVSIHPMCYIDGYGGLVIGSDVSVAHGVSVLTMDHDYATGVITRDQPVIKRPVRIGNNVWIGAGARVLGGVSIGDGAIVGAGAVVKQDVPPGSVVAGVPARIVKPA